MLYVRNWPFVMNVFLVFMLGLHVCNAGIFSWVFKDNENIDIKKPETTLNIDKSEETVISVNVPFETTTIDEKFMVAYSKYTSMDLSELDVCHHKVMLELHSSCTDMTEEELSKVAVNLLNCQSLTEGRPVFLCQNNMALNECTKSMDATTWNAYHIISNRVRAVCYQIRQQQFKFKTEYTVNKLMNTAQQQIGAMKMLEESQGVLKDATADTLKVLSSGHIELKKQQDDLSSAHINIHNYVASNLRELSREKNLIASGQKQLAQITLTIKKKLEDAQKQLVEQGNGQRNTHYQILKDLSDIQDNAGKVWNQLEMSTQKILETHEETVSQYGKLMDDLKTMNSTVHHLMKLLVTMKIKVEEKFSWISVLLGDTDATVQKIYSFALHVCYCITGMIAFSFLQVPYATKMALIVLVPLNALSELKTGTSLPMSTLSIILASWMFLNLCTVTAIKLYSWKKNKTEAVNYDQWASKIAAMPSKLFTPHKANLSSYSELSATPCTAIREFSSDEESPMKNNSINNSSLLGNSSFKYSHMNSIAESTNEDECSQNFSDKVRRRLVTLQQEEENEKFSNINNISFDSRRSRSNTPLKEHRYSLNGSVASKKVCGATCKSGLKCKIVASPGAEVCFRHLQGGSRASTPVSLKY